MTAADAIRASRNTGQPIPPGVYPFAEQLVVDQPIVGSGPGSVCTRLVYTGPTDRRAVLFPTGYWGGTPLKDIELVLPGAGIGIGIGCDPTHPPNGSQCGGFRCENVWVSGADVGWQVGDGDGRAASEITFASCRVINSRVGWQLRAWNTLNIRFEMLQTADLAIGVDCHEAQSVFVHGGTATRVKEVMVCRAGGTFGLHGLRLENDATSTVPCRLISALAPTAAQQVSVQGCATNGGPRDTPEIYARWGCQLSVRDCNLNGFVKYDASDRPRPFPGFGTVSIENTTTKGPKLHAISGRTAYDVRCCALVDADGQIKKRLHQYHGGGL